MLSSDRLPLRAFDDERKAVNLQHVYGIGQVPCDTRTREILDPVEPESLRPPFQSVFGAVQRGKALEEMVFIDGHYLLALDGTVYYSSQEVHCVLAFRASPPKRYRHLFPLDVGQRLAIPRPVRFHVGRTEIDSP